MPPFQCTNPLALHAWCFEKIKEWKEKQKSFVLIHKCSKNFQVFPSFPLSSQFRVVTTEGSTTLPESHCLYAWILQTFQFWVSFLSFIRSVLVQLVDFYCMTLNTLFLTLPVVIIIDWATVFFKLLLVLILRLDGHIKPLSNDVCTVYAHTTFMASTRTHFMF